MSGIEIWQEKSSGRVIGDRRQQASRLDQFSIDSAMRRAEHAVEYAPFGEPGVLATDFLRTVKYLEGREALIKAQEEEASVLSAEIDVKARVIHNLMDRIGDLQREIYDLKTYPPVLIYPTDPGVMARIKRLEETVGLA